MRKINTLAILFVSGALAVAISLPERAEAGKTRPVVKEATRTDTTAPLRQMPEIPPLPEVLGEIFERPLKRLPNRVGGGGGAAPDPVAQVSEGTVTAVPNDSGFEGVGNENAVLPPDPAGAIGPSHYVQMTNLSFAIYDRTGNVLMGPTNNNTLWQGFGGPCESRNDGDPIVLYDHLADRWLMSQFALPRNGPYSECIAVSQTGDPLGSWHRYQFEISQNKINDYPKFGLWSDGYYMAVNQFACTGPFCSWGGQGVVAFNRDKMLAGDASAEMVYFDMGLVDINLGAMLPADLDGPPPPAGAPNPFIEVDAAEWGFPFDQLQIWNFAVDWNAPANSTFTLAQVVATAAFDPDMCGGSRNCIPQPGGTDVDAIADRLMYRLQYRNFSTPTVTDQTLVVNHTVDVGDVNDHAGIRWYELNNDGTNWSIAQQGTYAPDADHRWMGSAAMNGNGDIALGYSVSSENTFPSIRFTGRLHGDAQGQMTIAEGEIIAGAGYQTHSSGRWGDYSMLTVDPIDDCTFWYTQEYNQVTGNAPWQTRIGSFQLAQCTTTNNPPTVALTNKVTTLAENAAASVRVKVADIVVTDDALGTNTLSLSGADAILFEIDNSTMELFLKAGTTPTPPTTLNVTVQVDDPSIDGQPDHSDSMAINITEVNNPPTVALTITVTTLGEDAALPTKVADIVITDDGVGTNSLSLIGTDAGLFQIAGAALMLNGPLDFETNPSLDVTVEVDDTSIGASPDGTDALSIMVTDVNEPPTVALTGKVTSLAEDANAVDHVKVADIVVTDDALGTNALSLAGTDAGDFEIGGFELFLKSAATTTLVPSTTLNVTVQVDDPSIPGIPDGTDSLAVDITAAGGGTASVAMDCRLFGGRNKDRNLDNIVIVTDGQGNPVQGAVVDVSILLPDGTTWQTSGSTASDGTVAFSVKNADVGDYVTTVDDVVAAPLVWDTVQPTDPTCTKP